MKKVFSVIVILVLLLAAAAYWLMGNLDQIVHDQIETQGSRVLGVPVRLEKVTLKLLDGLGELQGFSIDNPKGFSDNKLMTFSTVRLDLDTARVSADLVVIEEIMIDSVSALYELNAQSQGNINVLLDQMKRGQSASESSADAADGDAQSSADEIRIIVKNIVVKDTGLKLDLTAVGQKSYDETLPTFQATNIGGTEGLPASQVGAKIAEAMLDNLLKAVKEKQKARLKEKAVEKVKEKVTEKINEKANDKVKGLLDKFGHSFN